MHAGVLARHPKADLVTVYDVVPAVSAASAETARQLGVGCTSDIAAVLDNPAVRAVLIASPTNTHVPLIIRAVRAGKAVLCEKPIDFDTARATACWIEIKIATFDPIVMIGFNRRFDPSFRALRDRVAGGALGRLEQVIITSRDPALPPLAYSRGSAACSAT
jgi:myo-inositol 2-dehydrogenase/D-chiro-inositol 1-dehydrogenase